MRDQLLPVPVEYGDTEIYSGVVRLSGRTWARAVDPDDGPARTAFLFVHPTSNFLGHYALEPMARRGHTGVGLTTRYAGNDTALTFENCVLDIASCIRVLRDRGHQSVVLVGNSGGGGLAALYQAQAEHPTITGTPLGDAPDLTAHELPPADALTLLMAHPGRAQVYTEWLDPAIGDEEHPQRRVAELDMFDPRNGPPYSEEFLERYRAAQHERSARIRARVLDRLKHLASGDRPVADFSFVVHGTCADPRFLDLSIDPSTRETGTLWGDAWTANFAPAGLGRFASGRSWISQWSVADSRGHGPSHLPNVSVPIQIVWGTADQAAFPGHARLLYEAIAHGDKEIVEIPGANHYFVAQPHHVEQAIDAMVTWVRRHDLA